MKLAEFIADQLGYRKPEKDSEQSVAKPTELVGVKTKGVDLGTDSRLSLEVSLETFPTDGISVRELKKLILKLHKIYEKGIELLEVEFENE